MCLWNTLPEEMHSLALIRGPSGMSWYDHGCTHSPFLFPDLWVHDLVRKEGGEREPDNFRIPNYTLLYPPISCMIHSIPIPAPIYVIIEQIAWINTFLAHKGTMRASLDLISQEKGNGNGYNKFTIATTIIISSAEWQKGVNAVQWRSVENQKGAITIDFPLRTRRARYRHRCCTAIVPF